MSSVPGDLHPPADLVHTKLVPVGVQPLAIARQRLIDQLNAGVRRRLTLVAAPAGSGKTVLLAAWLASLADRERIAWLSLDEGDNDSARFRAHLVAALRWTGALSGRSSLRLSPHPPSGGRFLTWLVNELASLAEPVVLVLDEFHQLAEDGALADVEFLLTHGPSQLRIVLATRARPSVRLHALRLAGELTEIGPDELAFGPEEADELLAAHGLSLEPHRLTGLVMRTGGWAAGLRLAALGLAGSSDRDQFVRSFSGSAAEVADYLVSEVLDREPACRRRFMLLTSITSVLTGSLTDALTGEAGGDALLAEIAHTNLFLVARPTPIPSYRWHPMFGAALRGQLRREAPEELPLLHTRAAVWHVAHGNPREALQHAVSGRDWDLATSVAVEHWLELYARGEAVTLRRLLVGFPPERLAANPELSLAMAAALVETGDRAAAEELMTASAAHASLVPAKRRRAFEVAVTAVRLRFEQLLGRVGDAAAAARGLLPGLGPPGGLSIGARASRALLYQGLGTASIMEPAAEEAVGHLRSAIEAAGPARLIHIRLTSLAHLASAHTQLGELSAAIACGTEVVHHAIRRGQGDRQALAAACLAVGKAHYLRDDLDATRAHVDQAAEAVLRTDIPRRWGIARLQAWLHRASGDVASARAVLTEARRAMAEWAEPATWVGPMAALEEAEQVAAEGDLEAALELLSGPATGAPAGYRMPHVVQASIQVRTGSFAEARRTVEPWLERAPSRRVAGIAAWVLHAAASAGLGDEPSAQASLRRAVVLAAPESIRRPFVDEAHHVRPLLRQFAETRTPFTAFALELLERTSGPGRHGRSSWPGELTEPLSGRELTVLRHLQSPLTLAEIAGQLYVSVNTIKSQARSIYRKLGVDDRHQAARRARDLRLG